MHSRMSGSGVWPCRMSRSEGSPSRMSESGQEALPDVRKRLGDPPKSQGVVEKPSRMSGSGGRPSQMSGSGRETL